MTKTLTKPDKAEIVPVPTDPYDALIAEYVRSNRSPEEGRELFAFVREIKKAKAEEAYHVAMVACQAEMPVVMHDAENKHTGSGYSKLESIQFQIKPVYGRHGFSLSWGEEPMDKPGFFRCIADVMHVAGHSKRYYGEYPLDGAGAKGGSIMNSLQGRVSANTYAQRDMLRSIFNITISGRDLDGQYGTDLIDPEKAEEITRLLDETKASRGRFYEWLKVSSVEEIKVRDLPKVMGFLEDKLRQNGGGK